MREAITCGMTQLVLLSTPTLYSLLLPVDTFNCHMFTAMPMTRLSQRSQLILSMVILSLLTYLLASTYPSTGFPKFKHEPDFKYPAEAHPKAIAQEQPKRIAIVGAGASGSAAAWFIHRAGNVMKERVGKDVLGEIVIFEQSHRVGGS